MDKSMTVRAADMQPEARQWVAGLLHVNLADDDELTLALHRTSQREQRQSAARQRLLELLARTDEKSRDVPDAEMDRAIDEALEFVRATPGH